MKLIEIARSYTRKINTGNYTSADFFCSAKEEVEKKDAEKTSEELFKFCRKEVLKSIDDIRGQQIEKIKPPEQPKGTYQITPAQQKLVKESTKELRKTNQGEADQKLSEELGAKPF